MTKWEQPTWRIFWQDIFDPGYKSLVERGEIIIEWEIAILILFCLSDNEVLCLFVANLEVVAYEVDWHIAFDGCYAQILQLAWVNCIIVLITCRKWRETSSVFLMVSVEVEDKRYWEGRDHFRTFSWGLLRWFILALLIWSSSLELLVLKASFLGVPCSPLEHKSPTGSVQRSFWYGILSPHSD